MKPIWRIVCVCSILVGALLTMLSVVLAIQAWQLYPLLAVGCIFMGIPPMSLAACAWWVLTKERSVPDQYDCPNSGLIVWSVHHDTVHPLPMSEEKRKILFDNLKKDPEPLVRTGQGDYEKSWPKD